MNKLLLLAACSLSSFAMADIRLTPPTEYDNGAPLRSEDILRYEVCASATESDDCTNEFPITDLLVLAASIPTGTHHVRVRTVDVNENTGVYSPSFVGDFSYPNPPELVATRRIEITVEITE